MISKEKEVAESGKSSNTGESTFEFPFLKRMTYPVCA